MVLLIIGFSLIGAINCNYSNLHSRYIIGNGATDSFIIPSASYTSCKKLAIFIGNCQHYFYQSTNQCILRKKRHLLSWTFKFEESKILSFQNPQKEIVAFPVIVLKDRISCETICKQRNDCKSCYFLKESQGAISGECLLTNTNYFQFHPRGSYVVDPCQIQELLPFNK